MSSVGLIVSDIEDRGAFRQLHPTVGEVGYGYAAGELGGEDGEWDEVFLALDEGFCDAVDGMTAVDAARDLGNDEGGHVGLWVFTGVSYERARDLFGGHEADVGDEVAVDHVGHVDVEHNAGEVSAVVKEQVEVADVATVVEDGDEALVLFGCAVDLKAVDGAVVG